ncbi:hypothetical protein ABZV45_43845, partial [Streptomyces sp. NPDC005077]
MNPSAPRSSPLALTVLALLHYKPLHPYGIQRLVKDWGKEQVVNVRQLYLSGRVSPPVRRVGTPRGVGCGYQAAAASW